MVTRKLAANSRHGSSIRFVAILLIGSAGIVLATSTFIHFPLWVELSAFLVALIAAVVIAVMTWTDARESGLGIFATIWKSLRAVGRFLFDLG